MVRSCRRFDWQSDVLLKYNGFGESGAGRRSFCVWRAVILVKFGGLWLPGVEVGSHQSSVRGVKTARVLRRAVAIREINSNQLKARMLASSHQSTKRWFVTARVVWRTVAIREINSNQLKARMLAGSHQSSKRWFVTARVLWRAVAFAETTSILLRTKI